MRAIYVAAFLTVAALIPWNAPAQIQWAPAPPPEVTDDSVALDSDGGPIWFAGVWYYRTGPTVYFNGYTMSQVGEYEGVALYADSTLEPYSVVYIAVGHNLMRPYERRRAGELAGTTGSRVPSFPVQIVPPSYESPAPGGAVAPLEGAEVEAEAPGAAEEMVPAPSLMGARRQIADIWIEFEDARWYRAGPVTSFSPDRFIRRGVYHGFPVYREKNGTTDRVYIPSVPGGPLVPYAKR